MKREFGIVEISKFFLLAVVLSAGPIALVGAGYLPEWSIQLGALGPSVAAFVVVFSQGGFTNFKALGKDLFKWRAPIHVWLFALFVLAVPSLISVYLTGFITGNAFAFDTLPPLTALIPMFVILTIFAGFGEEFGWRGYLLPNLLKRQNAIVASLIVGLAWGLWHIPLFFTPGAVQGEWAQQAGLFSAIAGYTIFCIAWSVQYTWIHLRSNGSVLLAAVYHGTGNAWIGGYIDVYRGDVTGVFVFTGVMIVFSFLLYIAFGKELRPVGQPAPIAPPHP